MKTYTNLAEVAPLLADLHATYQQPAPCITLGPVSFVFGYASGAISYDTLDDMGNFLPSGGEEMPSHMSPLLMAAFIRECVFSSLAKMIVSRLTPSEVEYATAKERGEFRGFAALHDLFDANCLLLDVLPLNDDEGFQAQADRYNTLSTAITRQLLD